MGHGNSEEPVKNTRGKGRLLTFIIKDGEGVKLISTNTESPKVSIALSDLIKDGKISPEDVCCGAIKGNHELITKDELRKPTPTDLVKEIKQLKKENSDLKNMS